MLTKYRLFETDEFLKQLKKLGLAQGLVCKKLQTYVYPQLKVQPYVGLNIKKLVGYSPSTWRYRIGRYRLFYLVDDSELIVSLLTIEARKEAYR